MNGPLLPPGAGDTQLWQGQLPGYLGRAVAHPGLRATRRPLERDFKIFRLLDRGDFVGVAGRVFRTKTDELTIWTENLEFLAKCLVPLPEKWHGLTDVEIRYRQRYLDLIVNPDARGVFETRSRVLAAIRGFLDRCGASSKSKRR